jgi:hypothetical protein
MQTLYYKLIPNLSLVLLFSKWHLRQPISESTEKSASFVVLAKVLFGLRPSWQRF